MPGLSTRCPVVMFLSNLYRFLNVESEEKRIQYVTQVTVGPLISTIHRHVL